MPRIHNAVTGAVMTVSGETAKRLGAEWGAVKKSSERTDSPDSTWRVDELKAYAEDHGVDLNGATKKDDIIAAITAADQ